MNSTRYARLSGWSRTESTPPLWGGEPASQGGHRRPGGGGGGLDKGVRGRRTNQNREVEGWHEKGSTRLWRQLGFADLEVPSMCLRNVAPHHSPCCHVCMQGCMLMAPGRRLSSGGGCPNTSSVAQTDNDSGNKDVSLCCIFFGRVVLGIKLALVVLPFQRQARLFHYDLCISPKLTPSDDPSFDL